MTTSNELLVRSLELNGTPIIDAPTSWQYLVWKLEYDANRISDSSRLRDLHVVRAVQDLAAGKAAWLGRVPPAALIEIRKQGALSEIRQLLSKGIEDLASASQVDFSKTSGAVFENIQSAFEQHRRDVSALRAKKWKFAGSDVGSWLVVGSLAVTAAATGSAALGVVAWAANEALNAPKLRDIPKSISELAKESKRLERSPVGMFFSLSRDSAR